MVGWIIYSAENKNKNDWFIDSLIKSGKEKGLDLRLIIADKLSFGIADKKPSVSYCGEVLKMPDFVINRSIFPILSMYFEEFNIRVFNSYKVSKICNDKRLTHLYFNDVKSMETYFYDRRFFSGEIPLKYPCVVKPSDEHGGFGITIANNKEELISAIESYRANEFLVQKLSSNPGNDVRVYVMGGKIVAAALRSSESDFRSNFSLGGSVSLFELSEEQKEMVYKITNLLKLDYAGIDFIFDNGEMVFNEIEDVVGARMLYKLTDINVHEMYLDYIINCLETESKNA